MADGDYISKRSDIDSVFGKANVDQWANPDNIQDYKAVENRIDDANKFGESEFLGRIAEGPYSIGDVRAIKPNMAVIICASLAGMYLYDTRRVVDSQNATDEIGTQRKNANRWIQQIMAGQLKLIDPTTYELLPKTAENSPRVVSG